jgi:hypothetical protein
VLLIATIAIIGSFLLYCYEIHPVIKCTMDFPQVVYGEEEKLKLKAQNLGTSGSDIRLHVFLCNATILEETRTPYSKISRENVTFSLYLTGKSVENVEEIYFSINENVESFQVTYSVEKNPSPSMSGVIDYLFGELKLSSPTPLLYVRGGPQIYIIKLPDKSFNDFY